MDNMLARFVSGVMKLPFVNAMAGALYNLLSYLRVPLDGRQWDALLAARVRMSMSINSICVGLYPIQGTSPCEPRSTPDPKNMPNPHPRPSFPLKRLRSAQQPGAQGC